MPGVFPEGIDVIDDGPRVLALGRAAAVEQDVEFLKVGHNQPGKNQARLGSASGWSLFKLTWQGKARVAPYRF